MNTASTQNPTKLRGLRVGLIMLAAIACAAQVGWQFFNGGVVSHHLLHRENLPAISNWWSLITVPALCWFLTGQIIKRLENTIPPQQNRLKTLILWGFAGSFALGAALATAFTINQTSVASALFQAMFVSALFLPLYRAEFLLGFVLAMMFTFGAVLPTLIGSVIVAVSALLHLLIYPFVKRVLKSMLKAR